MSDLFDDASSEYVKIGDIDGRNVVMFPDKIADGKGDNGPYQYLVADVIVLDGPVTEKITSVPCEIPAMHFSSDLIRSNGERKLKQGDGRPFAGRINSQKGKFGNKAYGIQALDDDKRALANAEAGKFMASKAAAKDEFDI